MTLEVFLKQRIAAEGTLSVAQFMQEALSHPEYGYYQRQDPFGTQGDFITAPEISQVFGELLGIWCAVAWEGMGAPSAVALVELGPGRGTLMNDLLRGTKHIPHFHDALEVHLVETSPHLTTLQQQSLQKFHPMRFYWHQDITSLPQKPLFLVANELLDALPIHQYVKTNEGWREQGVGLHAETGAFLFEKMLPPKGVVLPKDMLEGAVVERCPAAVELVAAVSRHIASYGGAALFIDYGYEENGFKGTLQAVKSHRYHPVLEEVGNADLTAHVDFSALKQAAAKEKVAVYGTVPQSHLLEALGIEMRTKMLLQQMPREDWPLFLKGIERLVHPQAMGELFKVMAITAKEMPVPVGFEKE